MSDHTIIRITKDIFDLQKGGDLSLAAACKDADVRYVRALIIGPPETPYEFGFFEFKVKFGKDYPANPPTVTAITTNSGQTRFNPNIYSGGKVCLSILGTWRGEHGEQWSAAQGLESILISIQSLMSSNPYENEPGFEECDDTDSQEAYAAKIRHETIRISIIDRLEDYLKIPRRGIPATKKEIILYDSSNFEPFIDKCKLRFLWYFDSYLNTIDSEKQQHPDGKKFSAMPFECTGNTMDGTFQYGTLCRRLVELKQAIDAETACWAVEGKLGLEREFLFPHQLNCQFEEVAEIYKQSDASIVLNVELVDDNPLVWQLVLVGPAMSNLDGGVIRIRVCLSPRFPMEQPRARVETPLFHHRIAADGQLCYLAPRNTESMREHIEAIVAAVLDEKPTYDPRTRVNPDASKLLWGTPEEKKLYNRKLRRSVQESADYVQ